MSDPLRRDVVLLKKTVVHLQIYTQHSYEKLQKQPPTRIRNVGIDKLLDSYKLQPLHGEPIEQSIQLLQSCLPREGEGKGQGKREEKEGQEYTFRDFDSEDEEDYNEIVNTILANVRQYTARQCSNQINKIIQQLKECLVLVEQINETRVSIKRWLNTVKIGTLRELSKEVAKKNKMEPYDTATEFEFNKGGKRRKTRKMKRRRCRRSRRK
jgi:hypothetical protein